MRTLKELYTIIADVHLKRKDHGICLAMHRAVLDDLITYEEKDRLEKDFFAQFPTPLTSAFYHPAFRQLIASTGGYWWVNNGYGDKQRDKFLQKIIKKL